MFGPDMRVATIVNVGPTPATLSEVAQQEQMKPAFDPIQTPFDYIFYPFKAAFVYFGAGLELYRRRRMSYSAASTSGPGLSPDRTPTSLVW